MIVIIGKSSGHSIEIIIYLLFKFYLLFTYLFFLFFLSHYERKTLGSTSFNISQWQSRGAMRRQDFFWPCVPKLVLVS